jgi:hypothetical protein
MLVEAFGKQGLVKSQLSHQVKQAILAKQKKKEKLEGLYGTLS